MTTPEAHIHALARLGKDVRIWAGAQVRENVIIGDRTTIGQYCYVGPGVSIGADCKIQNHALIYEPAVISSGVFLGPRVIITNDLNPRAVNPDGSQKTQGDWQPRAATIRLGASLGAGVICVGGIDFGEWAMAAAGSVVTKDVPPFALVAGIPARQIGWVGEAGFRLREENGSFICPATGDTYKLIEPTVLAKSS